MTDSLATRATRTLVRMSYRGLLARRLVLNRTKGRVTVLLYHRIAERHDRSWLEAAGLPCTTPQSFRRHLEFLRSLGGRFFTLSDLESGQFPAESEPGFVITFDDGFVDNFTTARGILDEFQIPGVFFVTTSLPNKSILWDHRLAWLCRREEARNQFDELVARELNIRPLPGTSLWCCRQLLSHARVERILNSLESEFAALPDGEIVPLYGTWEQIVGASQAGHQIGAHTVHHFMRHTLSCAEFTEEVRLSKNEIERHIGRNVDSFSYPFNSHLFTDESLCRELGLRQVATVDPGRFSKQTSLGAIPRRTVFRIHDSLPRFCELLVDPGYAN